MRILALRLMGIGVVCVAFDLRIGFVDVLPDPVGWALIGYGCWKLCMNKGAVAAAVVAVASLPAAALPFSKVAYDAITNEIIQDPPPGSAYPEMLVYDQLTGARLLLELVALVGGGVLLWWLLGVFARWAGEAGRGDDARWLTLARWGVLLGWAAPLLVIWVAQAADGGGADPVLGDGLDLVAGAGAALLGATAWLLLTRAGRGWTGYERGHPRLAPEPTPS